MRMLPVDAAVTVFVNATSMIDDTDFKTREESVTYNQSGLDLLWNFETSAGVVTQTAVTPTDTAGVYDWTNVGNGMYKIEIPASAGGTINNDTEGYGFFSGFATGILPWTGPTYAFVKAHVVDGLITGTDNLQVDTTQVGGTAQTAGDIPALVTTVDTVVDGIQTDLDNGTDGLGALKAETALIVADTNELQTDNVPGLIAALNDPTAATIAGAVWDEDATSHQTGGTFGQAIGDPGANTETMYDAVITDAAGTNVAVDIVAVKAETALIVADTNELQTDDIPGTIAALNNISVNDVLNETLTSHVTADSVAVALKDVLADTNELQADDYPTSIAAIQSDTDDLQTQIGTAGAGLTNITLANDFSATMKTSITTAATAATPIAASVSGNVDGSVASVTAGVTIASGGIISGAIAAAELNTIADAILDRNMATGTDSGSTTVRTVRQALRALRNKVSISASTATITKEDDATASWTAAITTEAGNPITAVDPAGP